MIARSRPPDGNLVSEWPPPITPGRQQQHNNNGGGDGNNWRRDARRLYFVV
jgi:hypothetical protein